MKSEKQYEKGKLYQYDGEKFVELEPSGDIKLPISVDAMESVKEVRKVAQRLIGLRPELSLVGGAMLLAAAELPDIAEQVRAYGQRVYGSPATAAPAVEREVTPAGVEPQGETEQAPAVAERQGDALSVEETPVTSEPQGSTAQEKRPQVSATTYLD